MKAAGYVLDTNICAFYLRGKFDVDQAIDGLRDKMKRTGITRMRRIDKMKRTRITRMKRIWKAIFNLLRQTDIISSKDLEDWGNSCIFAGRNK